MFVRRTLQLKSLTYNCTRQIGYLDMDYGISPTEHLEPRQYDPMKVP